MHIHRHYIFLSLFLIGSCGIFKSAEDLYSEAEKKRNNGEPKLALSFLEKVVNKYTDHELAPKAQYLIGEIYYRDLGDFSKAIEEYDKIQINYPNAKQVPFSLFMQGFIYANMLSDFKQARNHYKDFLDLYNNHELAQSVKFELKYLGKDVKDIPELQHLTK